MMKSMQNAEFFFLEKKFLENPPQKRKILGR